MTWEFAVHAAALVAVLATAVVYGTDVFCAIVLRPAMAAVDEGVLVAALGSVHRYGDRRMPVPGALGLLSAALVVVLAAVTGHWAQASAAAAAVVSLGIWLGIYTQVSAPINRQMAAAAEAGRELTNTSALQSKWNSVIGARAGLQGVAVAALCAVLVM